MAAIKQDDGSYELELSEHIVSCGETITKVRFSRPRAKIYRQMAAAKDEAGRVFALVASVCGITPVAVEEMDLTDFTEVLTLVGGADPKV
jgi:energy-converting hydrogenase Eha subunit H